MPKPVRVLMSFGDPSRARNPYTRLLAESLPSELVTKSYFTWKRAFGATYDVFHVHWPHSLAGSRSKRRGLRNALLFLSLLFWLRVRRTPIVWTVHNRTPHERLGRLSRFALQVFERQVAYRIVLIGEAPGISGQHWEKIPHGHYRDAYHLHLDDPLPPDPVITQFGLLRRYKNSHILMSAFTDISDSGAHLLVAGKPVPSSYGDELTSIAQADPRIDLRIGFVPEDQLPELIAASSVVALPYAEMYNSGAALLALSANRPVLMPDVDSTRELVEEFGDHWVLTFSDTLTGDDLVAAITAARRCAGKKVDMSAREWPLIGERHAALYRRVVSH